MTKKNKRDQHGFVYSTDPEFKFESGQVPINTQAPDRQKLRIRLDTRNRAGKAVTLIEGFSGTEDDLNNLAKQLKNYCGTGGSAKAGEIIIQGDQRDKVIQWLQKNGYSSAKRSG
jgi:translation initiation factor 1